MNLRDLYEHVKLGMAEIRKEYHELHTMIENAKIEDIDYYDWPQYSRYLGLKAKWAVYREIKEMIAEILTHDPSL